MKDKILNLITEERIYGENSREIESLLVTLLIFHIRKDSNCNLKEILNSISPEISIYISDSIDIERVIIRAREETLNEKELVETGIVLTAENATKLTEKIRQEDEALRLSGLGKIKLLVMSSIRDNVLLGKDYAIFSCGYNWHDYDAEIEVVEWLKELGYDATRDNNTIRIFWKL